MSQRPLLAQIIGELDLAYLEHWIAELGLTSLWHRARSEAGF